MDIRAATAVDAAKCAEIYAPYVTDSAFSFELAAPDVDEMARRIEKYSKSHAWLVAEAGEGVFAYAYCSPHRTRSAYATSAEIGIYVSPDHHRKGAGRRLYQALFNEMRRRRIHAVFAGITMPNDPSIGFHKAMGFDLVGTYREVGRKFDRWHDVSWWQKTL